MENYFDKAIELHDQIKSHPFRETFTDEPRLGIWKFQCKEYLTLVIKLAYAVADYFWKERNERYGGDLTSEQVRHKTEWAHDLISLFCTIRYIWIEDKHSQEIVEGLNITQEEFFAKSGISDVNHMMIYIDRFIGLVHRFIETKELTEMAYCYYEQSTEPHNGYYWKHPTFVIENENGEWELIEPIKKFGTITIQNN